MKLSISFQALSAPARPEDPLPGTAPAWRHLLLALVLVAAQCLVVWHESGLFPHAGNDPDHCSICLSAGALHAAIPSLALPVLPSIIHGFAPVLVWHDFRPISPRAYAARAPPYRSTPRLI